MGKAERGFTWASYLQVTDKCYYRANAREFLCREKRGGESIPWKGILNTRTKPIRSFLHPSPPKVKYKDIKFVFLNEVDVNRNNFTCSKKGCKSLIRIPIPIPTQLLKFCPLSKKAFEYYSRFLYNHVILISMQKQS